MARRVFIAQKLINVNGNGIVLWMVVFRDSMFRYSKHRAVFDGRGLMYAGARGELGRSRENRSGLLGRDRLHERVDIAKDDLPGIRCDSVVDGRGVSKVPADTGCQQSNGNSTHELQNLSPMYRAKLLSMSRLSYSCPSNPFIRACLTR